VGLTKEKVIPEFPHSWYLNFRGRPGGKLLSLGSLGIILGLNGHIFNRRLVWRKSSYSHLTTACNQVPTKTVWFCRYNSRCISLCSFSFMGQAV